MTFLDETRQQAKLLEYRKELLANIPIFDGKDKKACLIIIIIIIYLNLLYSFIRLAGYVFVLTFYKIQEAPMSGMTVTLVRCPFSFSEQ